MDDDGRSGESGPVLNGAGPILVIEHEANTGLSLMQGPLGPRIRVLRPYLGEPLPGGLVPGGLVPGGLVPGGLVPGESRGDPSGPAGLIVLGGSMGAWDDDAAPWLPATRRLLADAVRRELPTLGICLGAQLLAAACGGTVERGSAGLEVGLVPVKPLTAAGGDRFFGQIDRTTSARRPGAAEVWPVHQYHRDAVTRLPPDAEMMVSGDRYPVQGFRVGAAAWAVQYHPEVSTSGFVGWVESGREAGELADDVLGLLGPIRAGEAVQQRTALAHARAFLDVVELSSGAATGDLRPASPTTFAM